MKIYDVTKLNFGDKTLLNKLAGAILNSVLWGVMQ
jgi:hypothetical protein